MSEPFALLWSSILRSSLWVRESKETRLVWITLLALRDVDGVVRSSVVGLADSAKVTKEECQKSLNILMSPDPDDTSKVEEGRRIRKVDGGWQIINHDKYRFSTEAKRIAWREQKAEQRAKQKLYLAKSKPTTGEQAALRALERGDQRGYDNISAELKETYKQS